MAAQVSFLIGFIVAAAGTRASMALARTLSVLDVPGEIKIHKEPTPRFGGFGIVLGALLGYIMVMGATNLWGQWGIATLSGGLVIALVGAIDDIRGLCPIHKLLGELAGGIVFISMSWMGLKGQVFPRTLIPLYAGLSMLFIAFMSNGLNLLDGMDGLAAGSTAIMASFMAALAFYEGNQELGLILMALVGACLGFLVYNLPRAKTFMGDIGSLFLGYMLAVASLQLWYRQPISITRVLGVLLILAVPITDTCLAIIRRFQAHRAIFSGDRFHLYDCIYRKLGRNTWATLATMWGIALASGAVGSFVFFTETTTAVSLTTFFAIGMIVLAGRVGSLHISATLDRHRMPM